MTRLPIQSCSPNPSLQLLLLVVVLLIIDGRNNNVSILVSSFPSSSSSSLSSFYKVLPLSSSALSLPTSAGSSTKRYSHTVDDQSSNAVGDESTSSSSSSISLVSQYLQRIGFTPNEVDEIISMSSSSFTTTTTAAAASTEATVAHNNDDVDTLQRILTQHLLTVPFENLDQHNHPPIQQDDEDDNCDDVEDGRRQLLPTTMSQQQQQDQDPLSTIKFIPRKDQDRLPSLNVENSLKKIIHDKRGGFCYELNFSFAWLLRSLGYKVRLAVADVGCKQKLIPAHVVVLVDDLNVVIDKDDTDIHVAEEQGEGRSESDATSRATSTLTTSSTTTRTVLVDVGFGSPGVCEVVLPLEYDQPKYNPFGDKFRFERVMEDPTNSSGSDHRNHQYDTVLYRTRIASIYNKDGDRTTKTDDDEEEEEPMYQFHSLDDKPYDAIEFQNGLNYVLNDSPTFTTKRLCVISTNVGHVTLGHDYIKWIEHRSRHGRGGAIVTRQELPTEKSWRDALQKHFNIVL